MPLADADLIDLIDFASRMADAAGAVLLKHFRVPLAIENKRDGGYDPVTEADKGAEAAMRSLLAEVHPDHGIHGEELGVQTGRSALTWVLDPLDGTRAFIIGSLAWGTLIALNDGERPVLGVINQPYTRERFIGSRLGAELRTDGGVTPLRSRRCPHLEDAVLCSTHPDMFRPGPEREAFDALGKRVRLLRYGGDCYNYAMLAHGFVDLVVEAGLAPYDVQALIPIVEAAGGIITDWSGGPANRGGQVIAAGDPGLHARALDILRSSAD